MWSPFLMQDHCPDVCPPAALQVECRRLLQELLHSPALGSASLSAAFKGSVDWLRAAHDGGGSMGAVSASGAQTFCFDVQVSAMLACPSALLCSLSDLVWRCLRLRHADLLLQRPGQQQS